MWLSQSVKLATIYIWYCALLTGPKIQRYTKRFCFTTIGFRKSCNILTVVVELSAISWYRNGKSLPRSQCVTKIQDGEDRVEELPRSSAYFVHQFTAVLFNFIVRCAGLMRSQQDPEMWWSVPFTCAWLYMSFLLFCLACVLSSEFSIFFLVMYLL